MATIQAGASSICTSEIRAAVIRSLSASGSINWPNVVTCFCRRARNPSSQSVRAATLKIAAPTSSFPSNSVHSTTTSSGTRKMRASVKLFGRFMGEAGGPHCSVRTDRSQHVGRAGGAPAGGPSAAGAKIPAA